MSTRIGNEHELGRLRSVLDCLDGCISFAFRSQPFWLNRCEEIKADEEIHASSNILAAPIKRGFQDLDREREVRVRKTKSSLEHLDLRSQYVEHTPLVHSPLGTRALTDCCLL